MLLKLARTRSAIGVLPFRSQTDNASDAASRASAVRPPRSNTSARAICEVAWAMSHSPRAAIANPEGLLRPEMAAHARVLTDPASAATRLFREPVRWMRLAWWRLWS